MMTFGKGKQLVPHRKQAAPPKARGRRTKELRKLAKQARAGDEDECKDKEGDDVEW
jgi:hypothetical protein